MNETLSTLNLVKHYFNICNTALTRNKDELIYGSVLTVLNRFASGETITLRVNDESGSAAGYYTTRYVDGQFTPVMEGDQDDADARFSLRRAFLKDVVEHAERYLENPEKLDWSWLTED